TSSFWPTWGAKISDVADTVPGWRYHNIWRDAMNTGVKYSNNVSFSGGNDVDRYFVSAYHMHHSGVIPAGYWKRSSLRFNNDFDITKKITLSSNISYMNTGGNHVGGDSFMEDLEYWAPNHDVRDYKFTKGPLK